jgi:hypothetical protein
MSIFPETKGISFIYKLQNWWDWLKAWRHPSNILFLDTPPTWCDKDELIRLAVFKLLVDFVEKEEPFKYNDWTTDEGIIKAAEVIKESYKWITKDRAVAKKKYEDKLHKWAETKSKKYWNKLLPSEEFVEKRDQEILLKIIEIRGYLWT